jgi:hypothetical protein
MARTVTALNERNLLYITKRKHLGCQHTKSRAHKTHLIAAPPESIVLQFRFAALGAQRGRA